MSIGEDTFKSWKLWTQHPNKYRCANAKDFALMCSDVTYEPQHLSLKNISSWEELANIKYTQITETPQESYNLIQKLPPWRKIELGFRMHSDSAKN